MHTFFRHDTAQKQHIPVFHQTVFPSNLIGWNRLIAFNAIGNESHITPIGVFEIALHVAAQHNHFIGTGSGGTLP